MFGNKTNAVEKAIRKNHVPALIELSENKDAGVSFKAIEGLGTLGGDDASHYLITRLQDTDAKVRAAVAQALGMVANKHTKAFLASQLKKETDETAKKAILDAMVKIKEY
ncbi:MAG: HEAT repeat domain-containing protein [Firmicutes bacterium]|nr:HEAT repeat domain-containing protein [Bacillota bacterium]